MAPLLAGRHSMIWVHSQEAARRLKAGEAIFSGQGQLLRFPDGELIGVDDGLPEEGTHPEMSEQTRRALDCVMQKET